MGALTAGVGVGALGVSTVLPTVLLSATVTGPLPPNVMVDLLSNFVTCGIPLSSPLPSSSSSEDEQSILSHLE